MTLADRLLPKFTKRRLAATLVKSFIRAPGRIHQRLNSENLFLFRQFAAIRARCGICGNVGSLYFDMPDRRLRREHGIDLLRETLECKSCGSSNRQRTLAYSLMRNLEGRIGRPVTSFAELKLAVADLAVWDTDAFSPLAARLLSSGQCILSKFLPGKPFGLELSRGVFNIDLQKISFDSNRFDVILSSDIMEHVRDDGAAHAEIFRCLKPGGSYIFTVPFNESWRRTCVLVDTTGESDVFLVTPHYHGDPISGGILAYRIYGQSLISDLERIGFAVEFLMLERAADGIFRGDCFIATKPG